MVLLFGAIALMLWFRHRGFATAEELSADEEKRLAALIDDNTVSEETDK